MSKITQNGEQLEIIIRSMHQDISSVLRIGSTFVRLGQQVTAQLRWAVCFCGRGHLEQ
jgi:hypothetical protein